ncbi:lactonase family protein [Thalassoglobus polymorphus]|uniref:6-phosphogluconolactonase n=1 Tax=Thalassoglobus polymorphus TaxID=2527994 RepID=A0A517QSF2_9PLAN|nr:lactonase family protein [Thalassoglobus polymorphus]QDT34566.1 6-phosphogluconolactonase [Thalassoglobus polymorphus]
MCRRVRILLPVFLVLTFLGRSKLVSSAEPTLFVSSFVAGDEGAIRAYEFNTKAGTLKLRHETTEVSSPFFLAVSEDGKFLYSIDAEKFGGPDDEEVAAFRIDKETGKLQRLNQQTARGTASCYLDIDSKGKCVVVANYSSGSVAAFPISNEGSIEPSASFIQHQGSSVDPKRQKGPNAHSIEISPDDRFALAADLGIDKILIYRLDAETATLTPNEQQSFVRLPPGSGPRHVTFHPNGKQVYVINELKNSVTHFDYEPESGRLTERKTISTLPDDFTEASYCADLKITPNGKFLYGTNRGHDSIAMYSIDENGALSLIGIEPSLGKGPQNLLISPNGKWLLCANMPGNNVVIFQIDQETGKLTAHGDQVEVKMPSCLRLLE